MRMHVDFFVFRDMSNHSNSCSQIFSNCCRDVTDGAISTMTAVGDNDIIAFGETFDNFSDRMYCISATRVFLNQTEHCS